MTAKNKNIMFLVIIVCFPKFYYGSHFPQYYCTAADSKYFNLLLHLIGSIHNSNFEELKEVAVFNLGFSVSQKSVLQKIRKVKVYELEKVNSYLLKDLKTSLQGRRVKGFF